MTKSYYKIHIKLRKWNLVAYKLKNNSIVRFKTVKGFSELNGLLNF